MAHLQLFFFFWIPFGSEKIVYNFFLNPFIIIKLVYNLVHMHEYI